MDHIHASVGHPSRTYLQQFCMDTGCSLEDLPGVMDRESQGNMCKQHNLIMISYFYTWNCDIALDFCALSIV